MFPSFPNCSVVWKNSLRWPLQGVSRELFMGSTRSGWEFVWVESLTYLHLAEFHWNLSVMDSCKKTGCERVLSPARVYSLHRWCLAVLSPISKYFPWPMPIQPQGRSAFKGSLKTMHALNPVTGSHICTTKLNFHRSLRSEDVYLWKKRVQGDAFRVCC